MPDIDRAGLRALRLRPPPHRRRRWDLGAVSSCQQRIFGPVPPPLSNWSLALMMRFRSPQLSQLRFAAVEFVSITTPDSLNRVRLGPESAVCVLPHRPSLSSSLEPLG